MSTRTDSQRLLSVSTVRSKTCEDEDCSLQVPQCGIDAQLLVLGARLRLGLAHRTVRTPPPSQWRQPAPFLFPQDHAVVFHIANVLPN